MKLTERTISDAKRIIYALGIRIHDNNIMLALAHYLNYCDEEQLKIDIGALDIAFTELLKRESEQ